MLPIGTHCARDVAGQVACNPDRGVVARRQAGQAQPDVLELAGTRRRGAEVVFHVNLAEVNRRLVHSDRLLNRQIARGRERCGCEGRIGRQQSTQRRARSRHVADRAGDVVAVVHDDLADRTVIDVEAIELVQRDDCADSACGAAAVNIQADGRALALRVVGLVAEQPHVRRERMPDCSSR